MNTRPNPQPPLNPQIARVFQTLRGRIRAYLAVEGAAWFLAHLGVLFWLSLVADWFWEPGPAVRRVAVWVVLAALVGDLWRLVARPLLRRISAHSLALLVERKFPKLNDRLLTVVEPEAPTGDGAWREAFLRETTDLLSAELATLRPGKLFRLRPLALALALGTCAAVSVWAFAWRCPTEFGIWKSRVFALSQERWPRQMFLEVQPFAEGKVRVARGADLEIRARAGFCEPEKHVGEPPKNVYLDYRTETGARHRVPMVREGGDAQSAFDYTHHFRAVLNSFTLDVSVGDASVRNLQVEVVDSPTLADVRLHVEFPAYTGRVAREVPAVGVNPVPHGARVTLRATANKPLRSVRALHQVGDAEPSETTLHPDTDSGLDLEWPLPVLEADTVLTLELHDRDGLTSFAPTRLTLACQPDAVPQVEATLSGIDSAVTPTAKIPFKGRVSDDYGLARVGIEYGLEKRTGATPQAGVPLELPPAPSDPSGVALWKPVADFDAIQTEWPLTDAPQAVFEVSKTGLNPGDTLHLAVVAEDRRSLLPPTPRWGRSQTVTLDVVTPERLRVLLEARELVLRQLYEVVRLEMVDSRDILAGVTVQNAAGTGVESATPADGATPAGNPAASESPTPTDHPAAADSPAPQPGVVGPDDEVLGAAVYRVERVVQNNRKNSYEMLGIAEGVESCCLQMVNNRIDTPEWLDRLANGVRYPLLALHETAIPALEADLARWRDALRVRDFPAAREARTSAMLKIDQIIIQMDAILEKMTELQDYNELVESFRQLIREEGELMEQVKKRQRQGLLELGGEE